MNAEKQFCGLECKSDDGFDIFLRFMDASIDLDGYYFAVVDASLVYKGAKFIIPAQLSQNELKNLQYSLVAERLVLHLYPIGVDAQEIDVYNDYIKSKCEMIVLIYDCDYLELYCKNQAWLDYILHLAENLPGVAVEKKYADSDSRTRMYV